MIKKLNINLNKNVSKIKLSKENIMESFKNVEKEIEEQTLINSRKQTLSKQHAKKFHTN